MMVTAPRSSPSSRSTRARDDTQTHEDTVVDHADADGGAGEPGTPARSAVADADDARDLECGGLDQFLDDTLADGQDGSTHEATSSSVGASVLVVGAAVVAAASSASR